MTFRKKLKGRTELCEKILEIYNKAQLENERISLAEDLYAISYINGSILFNGFSSPANCQLTSY